MDPFWYAITGRVPSQYPSNSGPPPLELRSREMGPLKRTMGPPSTVNPINSPKTEVEFSKSSSTFPWMVFLKRHRRVLLASESCEKCIGICRLSYTSLTDRTLFLLLGPSMILLIRFFTQSWIRCSKPAITRTGVPNARAHGLEVIISILNPRLIMTGKRLTDAFYFAKSVPWREWYPSSLLAIRPESWST